MEQQRINQIKQILTKKESEFNELTSRLKKQKVVVNFSLTIITLLLLAAIILINIVEVTCDYVTRPYWIQAMLIFFGLLPPLIIFTVLRFSNIRKLKSTVKNDSNYVIELKSKVIFLERYNC